MTTGFEAWDVPLACRRCEWWSAWEGQCVRSEDDPIPEDCPEADDDRDDQDDSDGRLLDDGDDVFGGPGDSLDSRTLRDSVDEDEDE